MAQANPLEVWLRDNKLMSIKAALETEQVSLDEIKDLADESDHELKLYAQNMLGLNLVVRKRFIAAVRRFQTPKNENWYKNHNSNVGNNNQYHNHSGSRYNNNNSGNIGNNNKNYQHSFNDNRRNNISRKICTPKSTSDPLPEVNAILDSGYHNGIVFGMNIAISLVGVVTIDIVQELMGYIQTNDINGIKRCIISSLKFGGVCKVLWSNIKKRKPTHDKIQESVRGYSQFVNKQTIPNEQAVHIMRKKEYNTDDVYVILLCHLLHQPQLSTLLYGISSIFVTGFTFEAIQNYVGQKIDQYKMLFLTEKDKLEMIIFITFLVVSSHC